MGRAVAPLAGDARNVAWRLYACRYCPHEEIRYDGPPAMCVCGAYDSFRDRGYLLPPRLVR